MPRPAEPSVLAELRDALARPFADEVVAHLPQVIELLDHQMAATTKHEQWKPLRAGLDLLAAGKATLASRIAKEVAQRFDAKLQPGDTVFGKTARFSLDSLSLVADDQVREEIAIGNAAKRLRDQLGEELFALTQRLETLMAAGSLSDETNPAFPRIFARGLYDALAQPGADAETRLAAFAAFGPTMLEVVRGVYHGANKLLIERGVLPDIKRTYGAPTQPATRAPAPATPGAPGATSGGYPRYAGEGAATGAGGPPAAAGAAAPQQPLERLLAAVHERERRATAAPPRDVMTSTSPGMVTIQVRPELVAALRALETRLPAAEGLAPAAEDDPDFAPNVLSADIRRAKRAMAGTLTRTDSLVADLLAALFERLLADRRLSDATKAQVGRLQLPFFKAIMKDHSFFNDAAHPIRQLIDTIAELGACDPAISIDDCTPEEWIAASVQNIVDAGDDDAAIFAGERDRLAAILERHHEATLEHDAEVLALRERERHLVAMREATLTIAHQVSASSASHEAASFLYRCWREVMVNDYLEGGEAGAEWKLDLEVLEDVLWVLVPRASSDERTRLAALLPSLIFRLKLGFVRARIDPDEAARRLEELRVLLDDVMRSPIAAAHGMRRKVAPEPVVDDYTATLHVSGAVREEGLVRGAWVEFRDPGGETRRCRLTWISPVQGACVFKDLERNRSFPIGLEELRERRRAGTAVLVDGPGVAASSVDGALADVAGGLDAQPPAAPRAAN
ncbi:MAG TPA: DUF1631 family protein [Usitatibacter sp.]|nr:DUF1631 family protein [Usitatibacter sp.]